MSNPGVIELAAITIGNDNLRIEDNIGEAIHIHYGNMRIDMTIKEFLEFAKTVADIMEKMVGVDGFSFKKYDARFLLDACPHILKLESIEFLEVSVEDLKTEHINDNGTVEFVPISKARVMRALHGDTEENDARKQVNYWKESNDVRLAKIYASIRRYGYVPEKFGNYIVLMDGGKYIYDGCHRASCVLNIYGNKMILVAMWHTKDAAYTDAKKFRELLINSNAIKKRKISIVKCRELVELIIRRDLTGKRVLIKGAGRHTEELLPILQKCGVLIVGITAENMATSKLIGIPFIPKKNIRNLEADVILISSFGYREEMREEMKAYADLFEIYDVYEQGIEREFFS